MNSKKEVFKKLVTNKKEDTVSKNRKRIENRLMLRESQTIALKVLNRLDDLGWTQIDLSKKMKVSPQQISKIVKGKENMTLDTLTRLQNILKIPILASFNDNVKTLKSVSVPITKVGEFITCVNSIKSETHSVKLYEGSYDYSKVDCYILGVGEKKSNKIRRIYKENIEHCLSQ